MTSSGSIADSEGFARFFRNITCRDPYDYQTRVAARLRTTAKDLLLTAPTGCGKTWATLAPFLHARAEGRPFADRLIYALPLRALASSLKVAAEETLEKAGLPVRITIQTGAEPEDETFDGDIVFTTIDQLLSSYLHMPLALSRRLANLNAGAVVGSLVVFDEAHLLEPSRALQTMLHMIGSHQGLARFVIATATLTAQVRSRLLGQPGMIEEGPAPKEMASIPVLAGRRRSWTRMNEPLSADHVRRLHGSGRTMVVVNSVRKAQDIASPLLDDPPGGARVLVLHSRFYPADRAATEAELAGTFGPDARSTNAILIATQVVEAGIDLSADRLLTEVAPGNALVQRAGRCARYLAPRNNGDVVVFDLERDERGQRRLGPYRAEHDRLALEAAWTALEGRDHVVLGADGESRLLEASMAACELAAFDTILSQEAIRQRREEVQRAWSNGNPSDLRLLVRDVQSVPVVLSDDPEEISLAAGPEVMSLPVATWRGFLRGIEAQGSHRLISRILEADSDDELPAGVQWKKWRRMDATDEWAELYCLPSKLAGYHRQLGLLLKPSDGLLPSVQYRSGRSLAALTFAFETYREHVERVLAHARQWLSQHPVAVDLLAAKLHATPDLIRGAVILGAGLHDVGKLDERWQGVAWAWQDHKGGPPRRRPFLAHTDYDPGSDAQDQARAEFRRPPHAVEGALAVLSIVDSWLQDLGCLDQAAGEALWRCVVSAISRHHAARAHNCGGFRWSRDAWTEALEPLLDGMGGILHRPTAGDFLAEPDPGDRAILEEALIRPDRDEKMWPLYSFVVRGLRLADQAATREGTERASKSNPGDTA